MTPKQYLQQVKILDSAIQAKENKFQYDDTQAMIEACCCELTVEELLARAAFNRAKVKSQ